MRRFTSNSPIYNMIKPIEALRKTDVFYSAFAAPQRVFIASQIGESEVNLRINLHLFVQLICW